MAIPLRGIAIVLAGLWYKSGSMEGYWRFLGEVGVVDVSGLQEPIRGRFQLLAPEGLVFEAVEFFFGSSTAKLTPRTMMPWIFRLLVIGGICATSSK